MNIFIYAVLFASHSLFANEDFSFLKSTLEFLSSPDEMATTPLCVPHTDPTDGPFIKCKDSNAPLFGNKDPHHFLEMEIMADQSDGGHSPAVLKYQENGKNIFVPAHLSPRGNSRKACQQKPYQMLFGGETLSKDKIEENYQDLVSSRQKNPLKWGIGKLEGVSQDKNIFDKLGDDIKIVNPCLILGKQDWLGAPNAEKAQDLLLREYYVYKMLELFETSTLKTKLIKITYKNPDGTVSSLDYSFFREPESKAMKRCGWKKELTPEQIQKNASTEENADSLFQLDLFFAFVGGTDYYFNGHNVATAFDENGKRTHIPYDFDTSGFVNTFYNSNGNEAEERGRMSNVLKQLVQQKLASAESLKYKKAFEAMISKKADLITLINNSLMTEESKKDFLQKIDLQLKTIEEAIANANNP